MLYLANKTCVALPGLKMAQKGEEQALPGSTRGPRRGWVPPLATQTDQDQAPPPPGPAHVRGSSRKTVCVFGRTLVVWGDGSGGVIRSLVLKIRRRHAPKTP
jgi:hypothetical protein